jgi:hypothetical protein
MTSNSNEEVRDTRKARKYPFSPFLTDLTGAVLLRTLEHFAFSGKWETKKQFLKDQAVTAWENPAPGTRINVRLMRYSRNGLLLRRRTNARYEYEYRLAPKGFRRYVYLLNMKGLLNPGAVKDSDDKGRMLNRIMLIKLLARQEIARLHSKLSPMGKKEELEIGLPLWVTLGYWD